MKVNPLSITMEQHHLSIKHVGRFLLFTYILLTNASTLTAQSESEEDPFNIDFNLRSKSSLPTPYGIIIGGLLYPLNSIKTTNPIFPFNFNIHAYYDAWQIGYDIRHYGNFYSVTLRSLGRDPYYGWFIEYSHDEIEIENSSKKTILKGSATGIGFKLSTDKFFQNDFIISTGVTFGIIDHGGEIPYFEIYGGLGTRIPYGISGIKISGFLGFGLLPTNNIFDSPEDMVFIGINTLIGINFLSE